MRGKFVQPQTSPFLSLIMQPLVSKHTLIHKKHRGLSNIKTSAQAWAIIHIIMFVIMIYHQNFVLISTALIKIYVL